MPISPKLKTIFKRANTLVVFFILCFSISILSFQFGRTKLSNEANPNLVEQDKIIYPIFATLLTLITPFLINAYMDQQLQQEVEKAKSKAIEDVYNDETSDGIRAKQELELVAFWVTDEVQSISSLINSTALLPKVKAEIDKRESKNKLKEIKQDENERYETLAILLSKKDNDDDSEVAKRIAKGATLAIFGITNEQMKNNQKAITFCNDLYKCIRAWLVCSLRNGRYMPVKLLKLTYPNEINKYKDAIELIYKEIIYKENAKEYFKTEASRKIMEKYLKELLNQL